MFSTTGAVAPACTLDSHMYDEITHIKQTSNTYDNIYKPLGLYP